MLLGSDDYIEEMIRVTNCDAKYRELSKTENESYLLMLQAEPAKGIPESISFGYQLKEGEIVDWWRDSRKTDFILQAPYRIWVDILRGKLGATQALVMRKLQVRGNFIRLMMTGDSTIRWVQILQKIPTEFVGEYSQYNIVAG